jgi:hypothetical protein
MGKTRCARIVTNAHQFQTNEWVYETESGLLSSNQVVEVHRLPHVALPEPIPEGITCPKGNYLFQLMESSVFRLTRQQRTPDWFLSRSFRCTSTAAHHIVNCVKAAYCNSDELSSLHEAAKRTAQLAVALNALTLERKDLLLKQ